MLEACTWGVEKRERKRKLPRTSGKRDSAEIVTRRDCARALIAFVRESGDAGGLGLDVGESDSGVALSELRRTRGVFWGSHDAEFYL